MIIIVIYVPNTCMFPICAVNWLQHDSPTPGTADSTVIIAVGTKTNGARCPVAMNFLLCFEARSTLN